jgi:sialate O-acetylesterase
MVYNGMIAPLIPFAITGAIWYQGEANSDRGYQYRSVLPELIRDWRQHWGQGDFPFYIVQLANLGSAPDEPGESEWAEVREAQEMTAATVDNCGIATAVDIGNPSDIHPTDKQDVGLRLSLVALAKHYHEKVVCSGPTLRSMRREGSAIRLRFGDTDGGLQVHGDKLASFAIAGADRHFVWADAKIEGDTIVVQAPSVADPVAVRYAWADNPTCSLYNGAGLPALPFRTDKWPGMSVNNK